MLLIITYKYNREHLLMHLTRSTKRQQTMTITQLIYLLGATESGKGGARRGLGGGGGVTSEERKKAEVGAAG